ncbi:MAG: DUF4292 domain-containing protein [bacterium]|nr:DUF4292 domain-containing protein [bacterium]
MIPKPFNTIRTKLWAFLAVACLYFFAAACETTGDTRPPPDLTDDASVELAEIRKLYAAPDCYVATFSIKGRAAGQAEQEARGVIRADNINQRLLLIFKDPFLGITLSRVVIKDGIVILSNPRNDLQRVPLDRFQMQGLGNNGIQLPFAVFQDLLFARLPDELFSEQATRTLTGTELNVNLQRPPEDFRYRFNERRLREIRYQQQAARPVDVQVKLEGTYRDTVFPARINLQALSPGNDRLQIRFLSINPGAVCRASQFSDR